MYKISIPKGAKAIIPIQSVNLFLWFGEGSLR